jgi:parallel beta-helix repeat protein
MKTLFLFFSMTVTTLISKGQTIVPGGSVSGTWTLAGSPYQVKGSIMIPKDSTLTIQPGVKIYFEDHYKLLVLGRLLAVGTVKDSILFTAKDTTLPWYGIRFDNTASTNDSSKLKYCVIQWGLANSGSVSDQRGGGLLFNNFSKASVLNCLIQKNSDYQIYCIGSSPKITHCVIIRSISGGGIQLDEHSTPNIAYNQILHNKGQGITALLADTDFLTISHNFICYNEYAGIFCTKANFDFSYNMICNNNPKKLLGGGGIWCDHNSGVISYNVISENHGWGGYGGGIFGYFMGGMISHNYISNNTSNNGGGVHLTGLSANPIVSNNLISNNTATDKGGGIYCVDRNHPEFINNTIVNNEAVYGGGVYCDQSYTAVFKNCILYGNTASTGGAQVFLNDELSDPAFLYSAIEGGSAAFGLNGNFYTGTYTKNIVSSPNFVAPSFGSGSTYTAIAGGWYLKTTSPCINAGDPVGPYPLADLADLPRIYNGRIDIGAFELQAVGIDEEFQQTLSVFPNPFNKQATIRLSSPVNNVSCKFFNLVGQLIRTDNSLSGSLFTISKNDLPAGIYLIQLLSGNKILANEKIVVTD